MAGDEFHKPYSLEIHGDIVRYLRERDGGFVTSHFLGPEHFFEIRERGLIVPRMSCIRVSQSPAPDLLYLINEEGMLEGGGYERYNMSAVDANRGVHDPEKVLRDMHWSIHNLNIPEI